VHGMLASESMSAHDLLFSSVSGTLGCISGPRRIVGSKGGRSCWFGAQAMPDPVGVDLPLCLSSGFIDATVFGGVGRGGFDLPGFFDNGFVHRGLVCLQQSEVQLYALYGGGHTSARGGVHGRGIGGVQGHSLGVGGDLRVLPVDRRAQSSGQCGGGWVATYTWGLGSRSGRRCVE
jgi:hypothetical protein